MKFISDDRIHLFIINPQLLEEYEIKLINKNIQENIEFRSYIDELRQFYIEIGKKTVNNVIELYPGKFASGNEIRLVAEQEQLNAKNIKYLGFHSSVSELILVRIFRDFSNDEYQLYLVTQEDKSRLKYAVLEIRELNQYLFADDKGIIVTKENIQFDKYNFNLYSPAGVFELDKSDATDTINVRSLNPGSDVKIEIENYNVRIVNGIETSGYEMKIFLIDKVKKTIKIDLDKEFQFQIQGDILFPARIVIIKN